jgi:hypothetical protein
MKLNKRARATLAMVGVTAIAGLSAGCGSDDVEQAADDVREEAEQAADDIRDEAEELENDISGDDDGGGGEESTTSTQSGY